MLVLPLLEPAVGRQQERQLFEVYHPRFLIPSLDLFLPYARAHLFLNLCHFSLDILYLEIYSLG
jgi:hypothetical protein